MPTDSEQLLERITASPGIFGGKPIIRGQRIAVEHVLAMLVAGDTQETVLREFPILEPADILACLLYAHHAIAGEHVMDRVTVSSRRIRIRR